MKKLVLLFSLITLFTANARDIYVYNGSTSIPVKKFIDVKRLTFTSGTMNVLLNNGNTESISLSDFTNFAFYDKTPTSINKNTLNKKFLFDGKNINVDGAKSIVVLNTQGLPVAKSSSSAINIESAPKGVYLVKVTFDKGKEFVQKISKN